MEAWRPQRDAAARNEQRILETARALLRTSEGSALDMRRVASEAGVGIGTLYRRFGDKGKLLAAVVGDDERRLQDAILRGPPPLGPGAPPAERLDAFLDALTELTEANLSALLVTDATPPGRLGVGAYEVWRLHLTMLLRELRPDLGGEDAGWHADVLLAALDPQLYADHRRRRRLSRKRIARNLRALAAKLA